VEDVVVHLRVGASLALGGDRIQRAVDVGRDGRDLALELERTVGRVQVQRGDGQVMLPAVVVRSGMRGDADHRAQPRTVAEPCDHGLVVVIIGFLAPTPSAYTETLGPGFAGDDPLVEPVHEIGLVVELVLFARVEGPVESHAGLAQGGRDELARDDRTGGEVVQGAIVQDVEAAERAEDDASTEREPIAHREIERGELDLGRDRDPLRDLAGDVRLVEDAACPAASLVGRRRLAGRR